MEAQRRKAQARRLKKQRALQRAQQEAAAAEAEAAEAAEDEGGGEGEGEEEADEAPECPICLLKLDEAGERCETLPGCGHCFHSCCISEWKATCRRKELALTCPYCRFGF